MRRAAAVTLLVVALMIVGCRPEGGADTGGLNGHSHPMGEEHGKRLWMGVALVGLAVAGCATALRRAET